ncbi:hypothetical protein FHS31_002647 [Sphingomonas vulcanisoli]|uniref:MAPEG family protein n=1 Tax=Sphingomonas vulcanisoli TaxID=1658060 RepID=A0ABX0TU25_9SPHN|nr:MAPEG family protein [Sphingomonas vulcanisoli]NIJ09017.1 hypothetical protein [Sphingomonas vulcanisoli]
MLPITLTMAAAAAIINIWLASRCVQVRMGAKIMTGDAGHPLMLCRMRAQANFAENAPFVLILLGLLEYAKGPQGWLWAVGIAFIVARVLHPIGMDQSLGGEPRHVPLRAIGIMVTWAVQLILAAAAIWIVYTGHR